MAPQLHASQSTLLAQLQNWKTGFLSLFSLLKINSEGFISELQRKSRDRSRSPDASLLPASGHTAGVCVSLHKSQGASLVQAQAREKAWGCPHPVPWRPSADTTRVPGAALEVLVLLWARHVGSGCHRGIMLGKENRWELMFCFPAK